MAQAAIPTTFPPPGTYHVSTTITLLCDTPGAALYYTTDGSLPTRTSTLYDPYRLIPLEAVTDGNRGVTRRIHLRAVAVKGGMQDSDPAEFFFAIERRDKDAYISREIHPGVWMIQDYDGDKMFLVKGDRKTLLIDTGFGNGDLRSYIETLAGGLPIDVAITHAHPDHIAQIDQFQTDCQVYMNHADLPMVDFFNERMKFNIDPAKIQDLPDGAVFDLGGCKLRVVVLPGHSAGCITLLDEQNAILYAGDALGSNRPANADSLWMQFEGNAPIDVYLSSLQVFRRRVGGKVKKIYTGHNDQPLGEAYMDNLQQACQNLVDHGVKILVPSPRPPSAWQSVVGDRITDPNWAAINVSRNRFLSVHFRIK